MNKPKYNRIKAVLAEKGVSNKELAEDLGVTEGTVSTWCRNFKQPKIETLFEIAKHLNVEAIDLLSSMKNYKS
ncbi:DNA-binding transcriptional regulator, XRE family [Chitinophaga sp. CF118]|uniref:helix-turn-helix transcriptional regulator n=1 Tax=Chitinophaga sp. CF118 TaxID=1884367 RepID=UPI0008EAED98|nr:helix-turn-helix transcriptional regulator [Chitinophaga sp. CF118]SFE67594.1 DNA-binding transcriptional regulator, XRE family [Chitinophaga sp. CF118]